MPALGDDPRDRGRERLLPVGTIAPGVTSPRAATKEWSAPSVQVRLLVIALIPWVGACASKPVGEAVFDFAAGFPRAEARREEAFIDIGTPDARPHLGRGWFTDESWPGGTTGAWSEGDASEIHFHMEEPRAFTLVLRGEPLDGGTGSRQVVTVTLNGSLLDRLRLAPRMRRYTVAAPAAATREGTNRLLLAYAFTAAPAERHPATGDARRLAVFWSSVELRGLAATAPPWVQEDTGTLVLPPGTRVDYYLRPPAGASLTLSALTATGTSGVLEVRVRPEGRPGRTVATLRPGRGRQIVPLGDTGNGLARVTLRHARQIPDPGSGAVLRLVGARLRAPRLSPTASPRVSGTAAPPPHVFVYLVDALRADRLGCYGYDRGTSPQIDTFARDALLVERTFAHSSWTKASVASLFTGRTPLRHGVQDRADALAADVPTLAETLRGAGYRTVTIYANAWVGPPWGLDRGFEDARRLYLARSDRIHDEIVSVLDTLGADPRPLLLYVHTIDPHDPYDPPARQWRRFAAPWTRMRRAGHDDLKHILAEVAADPARRGPRAEELSALYDAEVAANDEQFGRFLAELRRRGLLESSLVVFTADHGEEFFEHGDLKHGRTLFPEVLHVPLVIRFPGPTPRAGRIPAARHVDVLPTILAAAGVAVPASVEGQPIGAGSASNACVSMAQLRLDGRRLASLTFGHWHAIWTQSADAPAPRELALYDLRADVETEVSELFPVRAGFGRTELRFAATRAPERAVPGTAPSEEVRRSLKALGYVQ